MLAAFRVSTSYDIEYVGIAAQISRSKRSRISEAFAFKNAKRVGSGSLMAFFLSVVARRLPPFVEALWGNDYRAAHRATPPSLM